MLHPLEDDEIDFSDDDLEDLTVTKRQISYVVA